GIRDDLVAGVQTCALPIWEGDTLVVETVGIDERTWLDNGHEHSSRLKLRERFQKVDSETIKWSVTFDDPQFFVKPFTTSLTLKQIGRASCRKRVSSEALER